MLSIKTPFELNKESMILRNNDMYKHYNKLNLIKNRKNIYLPKINICPFFHNKYKNINKNKTNKNLLLFDLDKDNEKFNNRINQIKTRQNKRALNEIIFNVLLKQNKNSRDNRRKIKLDLLIKSNNDIKNRIKNIHPMINHKALKLEYLESRRIYHLNRKLKPCLSWGNIYFTKDDYSYMEKFGKKFHEKNYKSSNNSPLSKKIIKLNNIKVKKLGLSMSASKYNIK